MNCRTFQRNLEDYLQDGLDFSGRFGMERHAQQCIYCGKEMANAKRLSQMVLDLKRVKAPLNFESSVLNAIGKRKSNGGFSFIRRFWIYGIEWPSWQKSALAALSAVILGVGAFSLFRDVAPVQAPAPSLVSNKPAFINPKNDPVVNSEPARLKPSKTAKEPEVPVAAKPHRSTRKVLVPELESTETEYVEHLIAGPDNRPVIVRLPKKIRMQYGQTSEEYFIRNVSH